MTTTALPSGWSFKTLGELFDFKGGGTPSKKNPAYWGGDIPWASVKDIKNKYLSKTIDSITKEGLAGSAANLAEQGDLVLITRICPGKAAIASRTIAINQDCKVARPRAGIDTHWAYYLFLATEREFIKRSSGTTVLGISLNDVKEISVPVPSLEDQKLIVAKIEELFSELDNGIAALKTAREQLKIYRQTVLKHAFEGKLTAQWREENKDKLETPQQLLARIQKERSARYQQQLEEWKQAVKEWEDSGKEGKKPNRPKKYTPAEMEDESIEALPIPSSWEWVSFSELLFSIRGGTTIPPVDVATNFPILRSSSIRAGCLDLDDIRYIPDSSKISNDDHVKSSDLFFSRLNGTLEFVGCCALAPEFVPKNLLYPDRLYCAKLVFPDGAKLYEYYFSSPLVRRTIEKKAKSTAGHKRISIPDISGQLVPIFDGCEAKEIISLISEKLSIIEQNEKEIESALAKSELMRQSILKKAFSGAFLKII